MSTRARAHRMSVRDDGFAVEALDAIALQEWARDAVDFKAFAVQQRPALVAACAALPGAEMDVPAVDAFVKRTADAMAHATASARVGEIYHDVMHAVYDAIVYVSAQRSIALMDAMVDVLNAHVPASQLCLFVPSGADGFIKSFHLFATLAAARLNFKYAAIAACSANWPSPASLRGLGVQFVFFDDAAYSCLQLSLVYKILSERIPAEPGQRSPVLHAAVPFVFKCKDIVAHGLLRDIISESSNGLQTGLGVYARVEPLMRELEGIEAAGPRARVDHVHSMLKNWFVVGGIDALLYTQFRIADSISVPESVFFGEYPFWSGLRDSACAQRAHAFLGKPTVPRMGTSMYMCKGACFRRDYAKWFAHIMCPLPRFQYFKKLPKTLFEMGIDELNALAHSGAIIFNSLGTDVAARFLQANLPKSKEPLSPVLLKLLELYKSNQHRVFGFDAVVGAAAAAPSLHDLELPQHFETKLKNKFV